MGWERTVCWIWAFCDSCCTKVFRSALSFALRFCRALAVSGEMLTLSISIRCVQSHVLLLVMVAFHMCRETEPRRSWRLPMTGRRTSLPARACLLSIFSTQLPPARLVLVQPHATACTSNPPLPLDKLPGRLARPTPSHPLPPPRSVHQQNPAFPPWPSRLIGSPILRPPPREYLPPLLSALFAGSATSGFQDFTAGGHMVLKRTPTADNMDPTSTPQNTPASNAPISSRATAPGVVSEDPMAVY